MRASGINILVVILQTCALVLVDKSTVSCDIFVRDVQDCGWLLTVLLLFL